MARPLFAITEDFVALDAMLDRLDESDVTEEERSKIEQQLMDWLQQLTFEQRDKLDAYGWIIKRLEEEEQTAREVAKEFEAKARSRRAKVDRLKANMLAHMQATEQPKLLGQQWTFSVTPNGGQAPLNIYSEDILPEEFFVVPAPVPDKDKIRKVLEAGIEVPGANIASRGVHLRIR